MRLFLEFFLQPLLLSLINVVRGTQAQRKEMAANKRFRQTKLHFADCVKSSFFFLRVPSSPVEMINQLKKGNAYLIAQKEVAVSTFKGKPVSLLPFQYDSYHIRVLQILSLKPIITVIFTSSVNQITGFYHKDNILLHHVINNKLKMYNFKLGGRMTNRNHKQCTVIISNIA